MTPQATTELSFFFLSGVKIFSQYTLSAYCSENLGPQTFLNLQCAIEVKVQMRD